MSAWSLLSFLTTTLSRKGRFPLFLALKVNGMLEFTLFSLVEELFLFILRQACWRVINIKEPKRYWVWVS